jgi:hypothetical protein
MMPEKPNQLIDPEVQPHDDESGNNGVGVSSQPISLPHQPQQPPYGQQPSSQPQWGLPPPQQWQQPMPRQQEWQSQPRLYPPPPQYQQPPQYPPLMPPPQFAPKKPKSRKRLWLIIGVVVLVLIVIIAVASQAGNSNQPTTTTKQAQAQPTVVPTQARAQPTVVPTQAPKWTTTQNFLGTGSKKTAVFTVPGDWKIVWTCNPASFQGIDYNVIIIVYNSDGSLADTGVNSMCKKTNTHDSTEVHVSGNVYLDITSEGDWTVQVQELK